MLRWLCLLLCASAALSQPARCVDQSQCNEGFYCDRRFCQECLRCDDLMRSVLPVHVKCVTSVTDCGPCLPGLVNDPSGNVNAACVPASSVGGSLPVYVWAIVAALLLLLIAAVSAIVLYVLRHPDTLKILASPRASLQTSCRSPAASSPRDAPPPYSAPPPPPGYVAVRPTSPSLDTLEPGPPLPVRAEHESVLPFIKRADSQRLRSPRERDSNQEARVFNNPSYIRGPVLPPSYSAFKDDDASPADHDEETMESVWTPDHSGAGDPPVTSPASASEPPLSLSVLLSEARGATVVRPAEPDGDQPATKVLCVRQDSNNNSGPSSSGGGAAAGAGAGAGAAGDGGARHLTAVNFNITMQQHNDVKLIST